MVLLLVDTIIIICGGVICGFFLYKLEKCRDAKYEALSREI